MADRIEIDLDLLKYAETDRLREYVQEAHDRGVRGAAKHLGRNHSSISRAIERLQQRAALKGYECDKRRVKVRVESPFLVKGKSTYYDRDGQPTQEWIKTRVDGEQLDQAVRDFIADLSEEARGLAPVTPAPAVRDEDLLAVYPIGDPHFGLLAHAEETGDEDFDLELVSSRTFAAVDHLVSRAPPAGTALVASLGDLLHADNRSARTERSGHALDVAARWPVVMRRARIAFVRVIRRALEKHARVVVRLVIGNHDPHSSYALAAILEGYFANDPRVEIVTSMSAFWYFRFGRVLLGFTHGDTTKMAQLGGIMAYDRKLDWAETDWRYWYQGHIHHADKQMAKEFPGVVCEAFRTLAARDDWHSREGYRAGKDMCVIVHHREAGEWERLRCDAALLRSPGDAR